MYFKVTKYDVEVHESVKFIALCKRSIQYFPYKRFNHLKPHVQIALLLDTIRVTLYAPDGRQICAKSVTHRTIRFRPTRDYFTMKAHTLTLLNV